LCGVNDVRMGTATGEGEVTEYDGLHVKWYHIAFALSFGIGASLLPPSGVVTIAGWIGGALGSLTTTFIVSGVLLYAVRSFDDWRPNQLIEADTPNSRLKTLLFILICLELFVFGTQVAVNLDWVAVVVMLGPLNLFISVSIAGDMILLQRQGLEWETADYVYPIVALIVGFVGGLGYWYRRGRHRSHWLEQHEAQASDAKSGEEETEDSESVRGTDSRIVEDDN